MVKLLLFEMLVIEAFFFSFPKVDPYLKEPKNRVLFEQLEQLVQAREDTVFQIRKSENEVANYYRRWLYRGSWRDGTTLACCMCCMQVVVWDPPWSTTPPPPPILRDQLPHPTPSPIAHSPVA